MLTRKNLLPSLTALFLSTALVGLSPNLQAASSCKGLEKNACERKESCTWVNAYTRKDGIKVSGYCRAKGGKKSTSSAKKSASASSQSSSSSIIRGSSTTKPSSGKSKKTREDSEFPIF